MKKLALALVPVLLTACVGDVGMAREDLPRVEKACLASFDSVVEGWERLRGPVPVECLDLAETYTVELVSPAEMPCGDVVDLKPGERIIGCTHSWEGRIWLLEGIGEAKLVNISAHEWIHALQGCIEGHYAGGNLHAEPELWGEQGVETFAVVNSALGECL